jgi:hypothetical protein
MGLDPTFLAGGTFNEPIEPPGLFDVPVDPSAWEEVDRAERLELRIRVDPALAKLRELEVELDDISIELSADEPRALCEPQTG